MLSFQLPVRPDEVHSSGWKLVFKNNQCTVPENTTVLQITHTWVTGILWQPIWELSTSECHPLYSNTCSNYIHKHNLIIIINSTFDIALRWTTPGVQFSPGLYKDWFVVRLNFRVYSFLKASVYRWVLSSDLKLARLLHVLICLGESSISLVQHIWMISQEMFCVWSLVFPA